MRILSQGCQYYSNKKDNSNFANSATFAHIKVTYFFLLSLFGFSCIFMIQLGDLFNLSLWCHIPSLHTQVHHQVTNKQCFNISTSSSTHPPVASFNLLYTNVMSNNECTEATTLCTVLILNPNSWAVMCFSPQTLLHSNEAVKNCTQDTQIHNRWTKVQSVIVLARYQYFLTEKILTITIYHRYQLCSHR